MIRGNSIFQKSVPVIDKIFREMIELDGLLNDMVTIVEETVLHFWVIMIVFLKFAYCNENFHGDVMRTFVVSHCQALVHGKLRPTKSKPLLDGR